MIATINSIIPSDSGNMINVTFTDGDYTNNKNFSFDLDATEKNIRDAIKVDGKAQKQLLKKSDDLQGLINTDISIGDA